MKSAENKSIRELLKLRDPEQLIEKITSGIRSDLSEPLNRTGVVIGVSGGIDSSVTLALAVRALGKDKVLGLIMPEKESSGESAGMAWELAKIYGIRAIEFNISPALEALGCYKTRDEAIKRVFPEYEPGKYRISIGISREKIYENIPAVFYLLLVDHNGKEKKKILPVKEYLDIVAASNFKQRTRTSVLYHFADRYNYAVMGTSNRDELYLGFFVKVGDGSSDLVPISSFYKTQVFELAGHLGLPEKFIDRMPTTDTYSGSHSQQDFFYQLPFEELDVFLYAMENNVPVEVVAKEMNLPLEKARNVISNLKRKHNTTEYLRLNPILY